MFFFLLVKRHNTLKLSPVQDQVYVKRRRIQPQAVKECFLFFFFFPCKWKAPVIHRVQLEFLLPVFLFPLLHSTLLSRILGFSLSAEELFARLQFVWPTFFSSAYRDVAGILKEVEPA